VCGRTVIDEELLLRETPEGIVVTARRNGLEKLAIVKRVVRPA